MSHQVRRDLQDSLGESWATISTSDESGNLSELAEPDNVLQPVNNNDSDDTDLDETIPIDDLETQPVAYVSVHYPPHTVTGRAKSDFLWGTPVPPKDMRDFRPVHCSSSIQLCSEKSGMDCSSFDFSPQICSSKLENCHYGYSNSGALYANKPQSQANRLENHFKQPAPIISEIAKLKPHLRSMSSNSRMGSEEFRPQRCSTALSESQFKLQICPSELEENSAMFVPLRSSTGITKTTSSAPMPSIPDEFVPIRCSTGLEENTVAFIPLRSSTGLNESATFNPPLSSTYVKLENSNIPEFQNLRLQSESSLLVKK